MSDKNYAAVPNRAENKQDSVKTDSAFERANRQNSNYNKHDRPAPDNNLFWEDTANPLSSKGN